VGGTKKGGRTVLQANQVTLQELSHLSHLLLPKRKCGAQGKELVGEVGRRIGEGKSKKRRGQKKRGFIGGQYLLARNSYRNLLPPSDPRL